MAMKYFRIAERSQCMSIMTDEVVATQPSDQIGISRLT